MTVTSILFFSINHFVFMDVDKDSQYVEEIVLYKPLLLRPSSKFHKKFVSQFEKDWRESIASHLDARRNDRLIEQLPLYFLPNDSSCAVVVLLLEGLTVYRGNGNKFAIGKTGISSDGSFIMVYGYDPSKQRFDLLFNQRVVDFHGSYSKVGSRSHVGCPRLLISSMESTVGVDRYDLSLDLDTLKYVKSNAPVRVRIKKYISW
jgi:hypothetical protein